MPEQVCQVCGEHLDAASGHESKPNVGDVSICGYCGAAGIFDDNLNLVDPTPDMRDEINANEEIKKMREAILELRKKKNADFTR